MKFSTIDNNTILFPSDSWIVTGIFEESILFPTTIKIDKISQGYISKLLNRNIFDTTEIGHTIFLYDVPHCPSPCIVLVYCGNKNEFDPYHYKKILQKTLQSFKNNSLIKKILFYISELTIPQYEDYWKIRHTIEIISEKLYVFNKFKNNKISPYQSLQEIILSIPNNTLQSEYHKKAITDGSCIADGIKIAKDLGNMPPNLCTPNYLANQVQNLFNPYPNVQIKIIDALKMKKLGMNAYLSVSQGSSHDPVMPIIHYIGHPEVATVYPIILIGKGLTFDSGGISIKSSNKMDEMKYDMCGAASVLATMRIIAQLNLPLNVIGILATCENMISKTSFRPGDIITTLSGQTVEILNTDAEGRLVLCDVLTYVERYNPKIVIDIATLTGACVVALGHHFSGLMSNNEELVKDLIVASKQTQDHIWRLPLHEIFEKTLQSQCADMTNIGNAAGSAITAGCFLKKFTNKYNWAHLDIAGTAWISNHKDKSATGRPVALLSQYLINQAIN